MKSYKERYSDAEELVNLSPLKDWSLVRYLYNSGVSVRIIEDLTGFSKSKIQRYLAKNGVERKNLNTEKKKKRKKEVLSLWEEGYDILEIIEKVELTEQTIRGYINEK